MSTFYPLECVFSDATLHASVDEQVSKMMRENPCGKGPDLIGGNIGSGSHREQWSFLAFLRLDRRPPNSNECLLIVWTNIMKYLLLLVLCTAYSDCLQISSSASVERRRALKTLFEFAPPLALLIASPPTTANALDVDAFVDSEVRISFENDIRESAMQASNRPLTDTFMFHH